LILGLAFLSGLVARGWSDETRSGLSLAEFQELHQALQPAQDEAWRDLPWHTSILDAVGVAVRDKKPLYMLVRSGHPLGCV
jgi:hypothetical protein